MGPLANKLTFASVFVAGIVVGILVDRKIQITEDRPPANVSEVVPGKIDSASQMTSAVAVPASRQPRVSTAAQTPQEEVVRLLAAGKKDGFVDAIVRWAEADPQGAAAWALALPRGRERDGALKAVISTWVKSDPGA